MYDGKKKNNTQALVIFADGVNVQSTDITAFLSFFSSYYFFFYFTVNVKTIAVLVFFFFCWFIRCKRNPQPFPCCSPWTYILFIYICLSINCIIALDIYEVYRVRRLLVYIALYEDCCQNQTVVYKFRPHLLIIESHYEGLNL